MFSILKAAYPHIHPCLLFALNLSLELDAIVLSKGPFYNHVSQSNKSLPEIPYLPCVRLFAVCFLSSTRQTNFLPCAHTAKIWHTAKSMFAVCIFLHTAKPLFAVCLFSGTRQRLFAVCLFSGTRQTSCLPCAFFVAHGKQVLPITFWSPKRIQMKKILTTKLYNLSRCTIFVIIIFSYDKVKLNLFINYTPLSCSLWNFKREI